MVLTECEYLNSFEKNQFRREVKGKDRKTTIQQAMTIWFADMLYVLPLTREQQLQIVKELNNKVLEFGLQLEETLDNRNPLKIPEDIKLPVCYLGLADRKYVALTGMEEMLDIEEGTYATTNPAAFFETIQYNLTTLFMRRYNRIWSRDEANISENLNN